MSSGSVNELLHHRTPLWIWNVHILSGTSHQPPGSAEKNRSLIVVIVSTVCSVCAHPVITPMDWHLHGSSAMKGLAAISVPPVPNTTHNTVKTRGKWPDTQWHSREYPVLYRLISALFFFRHLSLCAFHSGRLPNKSVSECVHGSKRLKHWREERAACTECRRKHEQKTTSAAMYF